MTINTRLLSGRGALNNLDMLIKPDQHILLVTDQNIARLQSITELTQRLKTLSRKLTVIKDVPQEPSDTDVAGMVKHDSLDVDMVIGVGGGSVLDVAKLLSVLCQSTCNLTLEKLLEGEVPRSRCMSVLIPTTAGTGSEATPNAILALPDKETKVGIISAVLLPDYVILAPELTISVPPHITASTAVDTLCHLFECFTSNKANPVSDHYAMIGMKLWFSSIGKVVKNPDDLSARLDMLWAAYYGGVCITHSGTHLVHAMSYPLGGKFHIAHGLANSLLLVPCMKMIRPDSVAKFAQVYDLLPEAEALFSEEEKSIQLITSVEALIKLLSLPTRLEQIDVPGQSIPELAQNAMNVKRLIDNAPITVTEQELCSAYTSIQ